VLILNGVKVVCFDTLLQVLILNNLYCTKIVQNAACLARVATKHFGLLGPAPEIKNASKMLALRDTARNIIQHL
jgi:hypothetical protein